MTSPFSSILFSSWCLCAATLAQADPGRAIDHALSVRSATALQQEPEGWVGIGADYKCLFADGRVTFTPYLGKVAPRAMPLQLEVTGAGRGGVASVGAAELRAHERRIDYARPQLVERYEIRPEGVKQDFVFASLPAGDGDLIVRTRCATELRPDRTASDGAMRFSLPGIGGVDIGQVVGIDAEGRRATGSLRFDGEHLDFVLPAAFVAAAALPLVVDPLLSPLLVVQGTTDDDLDPEVAWLGNATDRYLVAWHRFAGVNDGDIIAFRALANLSGGNLMGIDTTNANSTSVCVTANEVTSSWFCTYQDDNDIAGRRITNPATLSNKLFIAASLNNEVEPASAGGIMSGQAALLVAYRDATADQIRVASVALGGVQPVVSSDVAVVTDALLVTSLRTPQLVRDNRISVTLLTYGVFSSLANTTGLRGQVLSLAGSPVTTVFASFPIAGSGSVSALQASVAGSNSNWVVAYIASSTLVPALLQCAPVRHGPGGVEVGAIRTISAAGQTFGNPVATSTGNSVLVAHTRVNGTAHDVLVVSLDPLTCADCESSILVDVGGNRTAIAMASRAFSATPSNECAIVWNPLAGVGNADIHMQRYVVADGDTTLLQGGCTAGRVFGTCARPGNSGFGVQLRGGPSLTQTFALLSPTVLNATCGTCTIVPDFWNGVVIGAGLTTAFGDARVDIPIPAVAALSGAAIIGQFLVPGNLCVGQFAVTDAARMTIE